MMDDNNEIECKFLDIVVEHLERKLGALGAQKQYKRLFRRYVFDYPDLRLNAKNSWVRVRDEGDQVTLGFKQRQGVVTGKSDQGMRELEVTVSDFEQTAEILKAVGLTPKFYEENWRTLYRLDGVEVAIDEWPLIPPYVEIEGESWEKVDDVARRLGFDPAQKLVCSTMQVYEKYGIQEMDYRILTFDKQERR